MQEAVIEYFKNYFDGQLNESVSKEQILEAAFDLIELCDLVLLEVKGLGTSGLKTRAQRATAVHSARQELASTLKDRGARKDLMNTAKGRNIIKKHETPLPKYVKVGEPPREGKPDSRKFEPYETKPWWRGPKKKALLDHPRSATYTKSQKAKRRAERAIEAGPKPDPKTKVKPSEAEHETQVQQAHDTATSDMQARLGKLQQKGRERRDLKHDVDIHAGYDPRLNELRSPEEKKSDIEALRKRMKKEREVSGRIIPEVGDKIAKQQRKIEDDSIRQDVVKDTEAMGDKHLTMKANLASIDPDITPRDMKKALLKHADDRRSSGELAFRGKVGRKKREKSGQLNLFGK